MGKGHPEAKLVFFGRFSVTWDWADPAFPHPGSTWEEQASNYLSSPLSHSIHTPPFSLRHQAAIFPSSAQPIPLYPPTEAQPQTERPKPSGPEVKIVEFSPIFIPFSTSGNPPLTFFPPFPCPRGTPGVVVLPRRQARRNRRGGFATAACATAAP